MVCKFKKLKINILNCFSPSEVNEDSNSSEVPHVEEILEETVLHTKR